MLTTRQLTVLLLVTVVVIGSLTAGYAQWTKTLFVDSTVGTGNLDIEWSGPYCQLDTEADGKDASEIVCSIEDDTLYVTLIDAYPSIWYTCVFDVTGAGSVPVHFEEGIVWTIPEPPKVEVEVDWWDQRPPCDQPPPGNPIWMNCSTVQLHDGDSIYGEIRVHLTDDAQPASTYEFEGELTGVQWNDCPDPCLTNSPPTTTLTYPNGGSFHVGDVVPVTWTADDPDGVTSAKPLIVDLYLDSCSGDGCPNYSTKPPDSHLRPGYSWDDPYPFMIETGIFQTTTGEWIYEWTIPNHWYLISSHDTIKVVVTDICDATAEFDGGDFCPPPEATVTGVSSSHFGIQAPEPDLPGSSRDWGDR